jgi:LEA14-like dessication related protein
VSPVSAAWRARIPQAWAALAAALLLLVGCASLAGRDPLDVTVAGIEPMPEKGEGLELRLLVKLRVQNPNSAPFSYDGAYVKVEVQDRTFASGVSNAGGSIPGFSEAVVEVPVTVSMFRMVRQIMGLKNEAPAEKIRYSMSGKLGSHRFSANGEFALKPEPEAEAPGAT